jgi:hypothetical protein
MQYYVDALPSFIAVVSVHFSMIWGEIAPDS